MSMSKDTEARLLRIIDLLKTQTLNGTLEWKESFSRSYQATLAGQTLVLNKGIETPNSVLEIRGRKGEVIEQIAKTDIGMIEFVNSFNPKQSKFSARITDAVDELYSLVAQRKETILDAALDNLLNALESRSR